MATQILPEDRFGKWTVIGKGEQKGKHRLIKVKCDCGTIREIQRTGLLNGKSQSCGCMFPEKIAKANTKHAMTGTPIYHSWQAMLRRCTTPNNSMFYLYGKRGIDVCNEWHSFENFFADMGDRPEGTSLDRIDNDKGYSPENCRWATPREQANNRRTTKHTDIEYLGKKQSLSEWADEVGIKASVLYARIFRMKWGLERAFTQPVKEYKK